jgi:predicted nucleotidyltransferase component of viral defense system
MGKSILTREQQKVLGAISKEKFITDSFFFTGDTALSEFYFQHRFSEDLDFFSEQEFDSQRLLATINKIAGKLKLTKVEQQSLTGQEVFYLYFSKGKSIKIDFAYFPFNHLGEFKKWKGLRISSVDDIATNKIHAITTRKRKRDYFDLYLCATQLNWSADDFKKTTN